MMLQLCKMAMIHCNNAVWVPTTIIHPEKWLPLVENSPFFAQRTVRPQGVTRSPVRVKSNHTPTHPHTHTHTHTCSTRASHGLECVQRTDQWFGGHYVTLCNYVTL